MVVCGFLAGWVLAFSFDGVAREAQPIRFWIGIVFWCVVATLFGGMGISRLWLIVNHESRNSRGTVSWTELLGFTFLVIWAEFWFRYMSPALPQKHRGD